MTLTIAKEGHVTYTERAFAEDAHEAMGGRIEKGLVELITNSDDRYTVLGSKEGRIRIEMQHVRGRGYTVVVRDRAGGMTDKEMERKLTVLGGRTSGFETGQNTRGLLGRGAKDVAAFGPVRFEAIKDNRYSRLDLFPTGAYKLYRSMSATPDLRHQLKVDKGGGLVVTVDVQKQFACPGHADIAQHLQIYYSLRDIMADPNRRVLLVSTNNSESTPLRYAYPAGTLSHQRTFDLGPDYPGGTAEIALYRSPERFVEDKRGPYRQNAILIKGRRAIHDITMFGFENDAYSEWFWGYLRCPMIDDLVREYDDREAAKHPHPEANPTRILTRRRDGLDPEHPFTKRLYAKAREIMKVEIDKERARQEEESSRIESDETTQLLRKMASAASRFMSEKLRELEEEGGGSGLGDPNRPVRPLAIIPSDLRIVTGTTKSISVLARKGEDPLPHVRLDVDADLVSLSSSDLVLVDREHLPGVASATVRVTAKGTPGIAVLTARMGEISDEALINVILEAVTPTEPTTFEFERDSYTLPLKKTKRLTVVCPNQLLGGAERTVLLKSDNPQIVIRTPKVALRDSGRGAFSHAEVEVEGRKLNERGKVTATMGDLHTVTSVRVATGSGGTFKIELVNEELGSYRASWTHDGGVLKIAAKHPSVARYLGPAPGYQGQRRPHFRMLLAEVVADNVARRILLARERAEERKGRAMHLDVTGFYSAHYRELSELLAILHESMIPTAEAKELRA